MAWTKAKTAGVVGVGILVVAGITIAILESNAEAERTKDPVTYEVLHHSLRERVFPQKVSADELKHQLVGTWGIEAKKFANTPKYTRFAKDNRRLKTWTLTNWSIITYDADSNVVYSASGPYEIQGDIYIETIETATGNMTNYIGAHPKFQIRIDGDRYYQRSPGNRPALEEIGYRIQP